MEINYSHEFRAGFSSGMEDPSVFNSFTSTFEFDDPFTLNQQAPMSMFIDNTHHHLYAPNFFMEPSPTPTPRPSKQLKTSSCITSDHYSPMLNHINHTITNLPPKDDVSSNTTTLAFTSQPRLTRLTTPQDHILAERKRRQKLSQRFIALSALVPGLKKLDKASVLGDAIKYLKTLQERVKTLEEQMNKKPNVESVFSGDQQRLPEVEARSSGNDVLIRVHCEKKTGVLEDTLAEIQKHHLTVVNTTAMAFATHALDITVVAQMDQEFSMTMKDLVKNLHTGLKRFM